MTLYEKLTKPFPEDEIEWRIGRSWKDQGGIQATCLAYITSRAIQERLDEAIGPENWQTHYEFIDGAKDMTTPGVMASIGIRSDNNWVYKQDGSEQTHIESFKGGLSGAFKRAAVVWGIGRYLYKLEEYKAKIVSQSVSGSVWGQTKERESFYWLPPALPLWAVPVAEKVKEVNDDKTVKIMPSLDRSSWQQDTKILATQNKWPLLSVKEYLQCRFNKKELALLTQDEYETLHSVIKERTHLDVFSNIARDTNSQWVTNG